MTLKLHPKPEVDKVSPAMWITASSRIMGQMLDESGKNFDARAYLQYTETVGELSARYTLQSVLLFDEEYRQRLAKQDFPWGTDAPHLGTVTVGHSRHHSRRIRQQGATPTAAVPSGRRGRNCASSSTVGPVITALVATTNTCAPPAAAAVMTVTIRPRRLHQPWRRPSARAATPRTQRSRQMAPRKAPPTVAPFLPLIHIRLAS